MVSLVQGGQTTTTWCAPAPEDEGIEGLGAHLARMIAPFQGLAGG